MKSGSTLKIARKYAEALALIKLDANLVSELTAISECFAAGSELAKLLNNPKLQAEQKIELINKVFAGKLEEETLQLLKLLVKRRRLAIAECLGEAYRDAYNRARGITEAKLSTAAELSPTELNQIKIQLEKIFNKKIELSSCQDPSLIAGQRIEVAGKVIDNSIQSKLKQLKHLVR